VRLAHSDPGTIYEIQVRGKLDKGWEEWLGGLSVAFKHDSEKPDTTTLVGRVADQSALRGILCKLWDLNLTLISVRRITKGEQDDGHASNV
jgi:hypothetical protein